MFLAHLQDYQDDSSSSASRTSRTFSSEFARLVYEKSKDGLVFCGAEKLVEFRIYESHRSQSSETTLPDSTIFYCMICKCKCRTSDVVRHVSSFLHIFRYIKKYYPIEYKRILCENVSRDPVEYAVRHFTVMLRFLDERNAFPVQEPFKIDIRMQRGERQPDARIQRELANLNRNQPAVAVPLNELPDLEARLDRRYMNVDRGQLPEQVQPDFEDLHIESSDQMRSSPSPPPSPHANFLERIAEMNDESDNATIYILSEKRRHESSNSISSLCHDAKRARSSNDKTPPKTVVVNKGLGGDTATDFDELDPNRQNYLRMTIQNVVDGTEPFTQTLYDTITQYLEWIDRLVDNEETSNRLVELVEDFRAQSNPQRVDNYELEGEHYNIAMDDESDEDNDDQQFDNNNDEDNYY